MQSLSKISLASWVVFLVFVGTALPDAKWRIYWTWALLGLLAAVLLIWGLRANKRLGLINGAAAALLLVTYVLYWTVTATTTYAATPGSTVVTSYIQDLSYLIRGNFQQGQVWRALTIIYVQFLMPCLQLVVLATTLFLARRKSRIDTRSATAPIRR
jgi:hypothetical protein